jgi:hypothetical protein
MTRPYRACVPLHLMDSDPRDEEPEGEPVEDEEPEPYEPDDDPALDFAYDPPTLNRSADK